MRMVIWTASWLCITSIACRPVTPKPDSGTRVFESGDPLITGMAFACDATRGEWTAAVRTDAWVGSARLWMGTRPENLERHDFAINRSAPDGTWDCVDHTIQMADDIASPGSGTRFRCSDRSVLHVLVAVTESTNGRWTDCTSWGPDDADPWESVGGVPTCDVRQEIPLDAETYAWSSGDVADCP